jgi:hypothetical protein
MSCLNWKNVILEELVLICGCQKEHMMFLHWWLAFSMKNGNLNIL